MHTHSYMHVCVHAHTRTLTHTYLRMYIHMCKQLYLHAHTHVHAQMHNIRVHPRRSRKSPGLGTSGTCWRVGGGGARWALPRSDSLQPAGYSPGEGQEPGQGRAGQAVKCK